MDDKLNDLLENVGDMALKRRAREVIKQLNLKTGDKVLDLGCGNGYYCYLLSMLPIKLEVYGVDNHINAINDAKMFVKNKHTRFIIADAMNIPFPKNFFDKVIMSEVIEHVTDDIGVLKEVRRVLKPKGVFILTTPNKNYPFLWDPINWILEHLFGFHIRSGFFAGIWNQHLRLYNPEGLREKLHKAGFKNVSPELLTGWCLPFNHYLLNLGSILLYYRKLDKGLLQDINKFNDSKSKKTSLASLLFRLVNMVDKLNDIFPSKEGVSLVMIAS